MESPTEKNPHHHALCINDFSTKSDFIMGTDSLTQEKPYQCSKCLEDFSDECGLVSHMITHTEGKTEPCLECIKGFAKESDFISHMSTHTQGKPYQCSVCLEDFTDKFNLVTHMRTHDEREPYQCSMCSEAFSSKSCLITHMITHTGKKPYHCSECFKVFLRRYDLLSHMRTHTGEKPYQCPVCFRYFSHKSAVTTHIRTHTGQKPYKCSVCFKGFSRKYDLVIHLRIHTGEKPHQCLVCFKRFTQKANLVSHRLIHTGVKPHQCSVCPKDFTMKRDLLRHMRIHTGEKPYKCTVCVKAFKQQSVLVNHMKIHTDDQPSVFRSFKQLGMNWTIKIFVAARTCWFKEPSYFVHYDGGSGFDTNEDCLVVIHGLSDAVPRKYPVLLPTILLPNPPYSLLALHASRLSRLLSNHPPSNLLLVRSHSSSPESIESVAQYVVAGTPVSLSQKRKPGSSPSSSSEDLSLLTPPGLGSRIDLLNGHTSTLDLCIERGPFTMAQIWTGPYLGSDHLPIVISFGGTVHPALTTRRSKWNFSEEGWHVYEADDWSTLSPVTADLHGSADALSESLFSVGSRHFRRISGQTTNPARHGAPWWTPECRQAVLDRRRAWNSWRCHPTPLQQQTLRRVDARCRRTVLLAKHKAWADYYASLRFDSSSAGAWVFVRKMTGRYSRPSIPLRDPSGNGGLGPASSDRRGPLSLDRYGTQVAGGRSRRPSADVEASCGLPSGLMPSSREHHDTALRLAHLMVYSCLCCMQYNLQLPADLRLGYSPILRLEECHAVPTAKTMKLVTNNASLIVTCQNKPSLFLVFKNPENNLMNHHTMATHTENESYQHELSLNDFSTKSDSKCSKCLEDFSDESDLVSHMITHTEDKTEQCLECIKGFAEKSDFISHMNTHSRDKPYHCSLCLESFTDKSNLLSHMRTHREKKPFQCSKCSEGFFDESLLISHMITHTGKLYHCSECFKDFSRKYDLLSHMRTHTGEKPHQCPVCLKYFSHKSAVIIHTRTHTGQKPYKCSECLKGFKRKSDLVIHMRIHTGEKPYQCSVCPKSFIQKTTLVAHMLTHTREKPHQCSVCLKVFTLKPNLVRHMKLHTGEKSYKCSVCLKDFSQSALASHMKIHTEGRPSVFRAFKKTLNI
ncbi:zinc finger protein 585A-like [Procambarus clarkii]|uniref:zinc finger protein 585A-like n=1 Tax=Procambarus clarkii TaxID=6728 RepID=UPI0037447478